MTGGEPRVVIIGGGVSGVGMACALKEQGLTDFTLYEKAAGVGGTWHHNRYPGLSCDVPSRFYQYSFDLNPGWNRLFAPGNEIRSYVEGVVERHRLGPHVALGTEITEARWDRGRWHVTCDDGSVDEADVLVCATGVLHRPRIPDLPGLETFAGATFHSSRWDDDEQLAGRRVAVIGTGSTGVQITGALAGVASKVTVFQRSRHWVMYAPNPRYTRAGKALARRFPALGRLGYHGYRATLFDFLSQATVLRGPRRRISQAVVRANHRFLIRDPDLRERVTPDYPPLCKRLIVSPTWFRAIQRPDVDVVDAGIERVVPAGIVDRSGRLHEVDVIALATGFDAQAFMRPMRISGEGGVTLEDAWRDGPRAFQTVGLPGFPNLFTLQGPHSPAGNYSLLSLAETQISFVMSWIARIRAGDVAAVAPTQAATDAYYAKLRAQAPETVWSEGCRSWYHGPDGTVELWPWTARHFRELLARPRDEDFEIQVPPASEVTAATR
jgi:cation diffusion facilitator CzcD-associated flavoprotein CzcO